MILRRGSKYGFGYIKDPDGYLVTPVRIALEKGVALPPSFSMRDPVYILDQGTTSSCVGHAIVGATETYFKCAGQPISHRSPTGMYTLARCVDRDGTNAPLQDAGSMPNQAMRAIVEWGMPAFGDDAADAPIYGGQPDDSKINNEPSLLELEDASQLEFRGMYEVDPKNISQIKQVLASRVPICFAVMVDNAFEMWSGGDPIGPPNPNDIIGGHYIYLVGYETLSTGKTVFTFANSWGVNWGDNGFGRGDESFISQASDMYCMNLVRV